MKELSSDDFINGQILLVDKPLEWTSFDVVKKLRYLIKKKFKFKKLKVGHAGTLDPLATGLLIICTGKYTKKIAELTLEDKTYTGTIRLGATTPSYDLETEPENFKTTQLLSAEEIHEAADGMIGESMQIPPVFSAKRVDGKRAYVAAREGKEITLKANPVEIKVFDVNTDSIPDIKFKIKCSKGTYIRSIARDLGDILDVGGHLIELRRTHIGDFDVENALTIEEFEEQLFNLNSMN